MSCKSSNDIQVATGSDMAADSVRRIGAPYDIEREIRQATPKTDAILATLDSPLVDHLHRWFKQKLTGSRASQRSPW
jgi:hypothetical protein